MLKDRINLHPFINNTEIITLIRIETQYLVFALFLHMELFCLTKSLSLRIKQNQTASYEKKISEEIAK
jgi:hypothetical protein